jgi:N-acetyl-alpha-D-muramate 1-phosphate uridylyltransferase
MHLVSPCALMGIWLYRHMGVAMQAFILAAGLGERFRPHTERAPKALMPVQGCALIEHHLYALAAAGFESVVINVYHLAQQLRDALGDGTRYGIPIAYSDETNTGLLGTYMGVRHGLGLLKTKPFLLLSADIYTPFPLASLKDKSPTHAHVVLVPNPAWHPEGDFAVTEDRLVKNGPTYTYANIGVFNPSFFSANEDNNVQLGDCLRILIPDKRIPAEIYRGQWHNVGTVAQWQAVASPKDRLP